MGKQFFYASGETIEAMVKESESYPECRFTYTPLTRGEHAECEDRLAKGSAVDISKLVADAIAKHVKTWNIVKSDGLQVDPTDVRATNRIVPQLTGDVFRVIFTTTQGDLPQPSEADDDADDADAGAAEAGGASGDAGPEDELGN